MTAKMRGSVSPAWLFLIILAVVGTTVAWTDSREGIPPSDCKFEYCLIAWKAIALSQKTSKHSFGNDLCHLVLDEGTEAVLTNQIRSVDDDSGKYCLSDPLWL